MLNAGTNNDKPKIEQDPKKAPKTTEQISKDEIKLRKRLRGVDISPIDLIFTIRHLALILKSGLPIGEAIGSVAGQSSNKKLNEVFGQIDRDVHEGKNLHDALSYYPKVFPQIAISIIKIGEEAGTLEKNLMFLTDYLKKKYELNKKIKGALFYPLVIMGMAFLEIAGVIFFVLPRMESLFMGFKNVPEFTLGIFAMTRFLRENILLLFAGLVVIIILVVLFLRTNPGKIFIDKLSLRFPVMNKLFRASILANIPRTLGILLSSGIPITQAVQTAYETIGNYEYENILKKVSEVRQNRLPFSFAVRFSKPLPKRSALETLPLFQALLLNKSSASRSFYKVSHTRGGSVDTSLPKGWPLDVCHQNA
jgi:type II secretory pathway component PulF